MDYPSIHEALTALCASGRHAVESGFSWQLLRASPHKAAQAALARALSVLQECFNPVVEPQSGKDLVPMMVFNQSVESADCSGFYTVSACKRGADCLLLCACVQARIELARRVLVE